MRFYKHFQKYDIALKRIIILKLSFPLIHSFEYPCHTADGFVENHISLLNYLCYLMAYSQSQVFFIQTCVQTLSLYLRANRGSAVGGVGEVIIAPPVEAAILSADLDFGVVAPFVCALGCIKRTLQSLLKSTTIIDKQYKYL